MSGSMDEVAAKLERVEETIMFLNNRIEELLAQLQLEERERQGLLQIIAERRGRHAGDD